MVKSLEMLGYTDQEALAVGFMTPALLAAYVPLYLTGDIRIPESGRNSLIFWNKKSGNFKNDFWSGFSNGNITGGLQVFIPINTDF